MIFSTIPQPPTHPFVLEITTRINPAANTALSGLYISSGTFCTQCEAEGFRHITFFPDRPDILATYTVTLVADEATYPVLLSNGNRTATGRGASGKHWATWHVSLSPSRVIFLQLSRASWPRFRDHFKTMSGARLHYQSGLNLALNPNAPMQWDALKRSMAWDEQVFGLEV